MHHSTHCAGCKKAVEAARYLAKRAQYMSRSRTVYQERKAARLCVLCVAPLSVSRLVYCEACRLKRDAVIRAKRLLVQAAGGRFGCGAEPMHLGGHVPGTMVRMVHAQLNADAFGCMDTLREREREWRQLNAEAEGVRDATELGRRRSLLFQNGRLMRYVIRCYWRDYVTLPIRPMSPKRKGKFRCAFGFTVDADTWAIIRWFSRERDGNISQTVRDLICAACYPPVFSGNVVPPVEAWTLGNPSD